MIRIIIWWKGGRSLWDGDMHQVEVSDQYERHPDMKLEIGRHPNDKQFARLNLSVRLAGDMND
jgi:hypothetical protein